MWNSFGYTAVVLVCGTPIFFLLLVIVHRYKYVCCKGDSQNAGRLFGRRELDVDVAAR
jgi:hypothetical protein